MKLIKYRDIGMQTYTYFWKNDSDQISSPFFDDEKTAMAWAAERETLDPKVLDDARAEDEVFEEIERKQKS